MSRLFARLYLDEDVSVLVATLLRSRGFETLTTLEVGNLGETDERQLEYAANDGLTLLTHNRADFEQLAARYLTDGRRHAGIIIAVRRLPHDIVRRVLTVINQHTADEIADNVWYL